MENLIAKLHEPTMGKEVGQDMERLPIGHLRMESVKCLVMVGILGKLNLFKTIKYK